MESRKEVVCKMVSLGMRTSKALDLASVPRSTYYYKSKGAKKGKRPSGVTRFNGAMVPDSQVIKTIEEILGQEFIDYGYIRTTKALQSFGYNINKKKVYRLMKEQGLLFPKRIARNHYKEYVAYTSPICKRPFELLEIDIKYIYIQGERRNAYLITMIDVFSRKALVWSLNWNMKTQRVVELLNELFTQWLIPLGIDPIKVKVKIRTDNGSQFIAKMFRNRLVKSGIDNEYIRPGTPQQNGHIEAFHSTLTKLVCLNYELKNFDHATEILNRFFDTYNNKRIMKAILYKSPNQFCNLWAKGEIVSKVINGKSKHFFKEKRPDIQALPSSEFLNVQNKFNQQFN